MFLAKDGVAPVPAGSLIRVDRGVLWLTQYPDCKDYFLRAGDSMRLGRWGAPLVSALRESEVRVLPPEPARNRWRDLMASVALRIRLA
jgi:hypothetical protein